MPRGTLLQQVLPNKRASGARGRASTTPPPIKAAVSLRIPVWPATRLGEQGKPANHVLWADAANARERNSAVVMYFQLGDAYDKLDRTPPSKSHLRRRMCLDVIENVMEEPLYDELRTQRDESRHGRHPTTAARPKLLLANTNVRSHVFRRRPG